MRASSRRTANAIGIGAALAIFLAACSADVQPAASVEAPPDSATVTSSTTIEVTPIPTAVYQPDAQLFEGAAELLEGGSYRITTVGTPFSFSVDEPMFVVGNGYGQFIVTHPGSQGPDDRDIVFFRSTRLSNPDDPTAALESEGDGWPANDVGGWLDRLSDDVVLVSDRATTTLGGLQATRVDLRIADVTCADSFSCVPLSTNQFLTHRFLTLGSQQRIWFVEQPGEDLLIVLVGINRPTDSDWFETAESVLSTLAFGEVGPNPLSIQGPGSLDLPFLGGVRFELGEEAFVTRDRIDRVLHRSEPAETDFVATLYDSEGNLLETTDDLVAAFEQAGSEINEIEPATIDGLAARVFDFGSPRGGELLIRPDSRANFFVPGRGRMWVIEHPDRGVLMISAEGPNEQYFETALALTEPIIESLEFVGSP